MTGAAGTSVRNRQSERRSWLLFGDTAGGRDLERPAASGLIDLEQFGALTERLVQLEAELDAVLRAFPDLYLLLDADGTILAPIPGTESELELERSI